MKSTFRLVFLLIAMALLPLTCFGQWGGLLNGLGGGEEENDYGYPDDEGYQYPQNPNGVASPVRRPTQPVQAKKKDPFKGDAADRLALIVAMRDYPQSRQLTALGGTERDALRLATVLKKGKFDDNNIVIVYDDASQAELRPTRANILRELKALAGRATEKSSISIFVTGHGLSLKGESYICPGNATDAALTDKQKASQELISVKEITTQLKNCKAAHKLLVVDACRDTSNNRTSGYVNNVAALEKPAEGVWIMSSCSEGQFSWMSDRIRKGERHALFSHFIIQGLEGDADLLGNNDGEVSLFELYTYAFVKTRDAAKEIHEKQTPELFGLASPFYVATSGSFVSRRTLTTNDPRMEDARSASLLADDVLINLRSADGEYRDTVSANDATEETIRQSSQVLHRYLCHLLGNRIHAALELSGDCRLAWVAKGLCYRTCGLYDQSLEAFQHGDEPFNLFVKAQPDTIQRYVVYDSEGNAMQDEEGNPIPQMKKTAATALDYALLYEHPGDKKAKFSLKRQQKVRIAKIQEPWLYVDAIDDVEIVEGGWIHRDEVHWFPEAIDLYTPTSPMRSWGGSTVNRLDYAADSLSALAERLAQPAERIEAAVERVSAPIDRFNSIAGRFGFGIPNYVGYYGGMAASYARIPSNYVAMGSGYARIPGNYASAARQWAGIAQDYYVGHHQSEQVEKSRKNLKNAGQLQPVKERPILQIDRPQQKNKR